MRYKDPGQSVTDTQGLAQVLASRAFCPDCHRLMEVLATTHVDGQREVPTAFKCHYCQEQWTSDVFKSREHCHHGVLLLRDCATCTDEARQSTEQILDELMDHRQKVRDT